MTPMIRTAALALAVTLALAASTLAAGPLAHADEGVALDVGSIKVEQRLSRGGTYNLPPIGVRNPGDEMTSYRMGIDFVEDQDGRRPKASWFSFEPEEFTLEPGQTTRVRIELKVPPGARPADYEALVVASIVTEGEGTALGGAAAARLDFEVKASNWLEALWLWLRYWFSDNAPWSYLIVGGVAAAGVFVALRRRFAFRIERR